MKVLRFFKNNCQQLDFYSQIFKLSFLTILEQICPLSCYNYVNEHFAKI